MKDCLILIEEKGLYKLFFKPTGYCLSSTSDYSAVMKTLRRLVRKYKRPERLERALSHLEDKGQVPPKVFEQWTSLLESGEVTVYNSVVKEEVNKVLEEMKGETPLGKLQKRKRLGHRVRPLETTTKSTTKTEEKSTSLTTTKKNKGLMKKKHLLTMD